MSDDLKSLRIDRSSQPSSGAGPVWAFRWILGGIAVMVLLGAGAIVYKQLNAATEVTTVRAQAAQTGGAPGDAVILNATGYVVAAHKIQVASKVVGKVAWIGVDKGDKVREGQVIVRLEDDEYRAYLQQARGQLANLQARLAELENGSRPEEIAAAKANVEQAQADLANAVVQLDRTRQLYSGGVAPKTNLDDAEARRDAAQARVNSLQKTYELVRIGPRREVIDAVKGQIEQVKGVVAFSETQLNNTIIRAPVTGTILERVVERGEFVTTSFVGERGAKGYVVSLADLNDLRVELDISQNDFNKLGPKQRGVITVDAYPGKQWQGAIEEISPEANRQKATVQVKVKVLNPDEYLRPEMNAAVAFLAEARPGGGAPAAGKPVVFIPSSTVRNDKVLIVVNGKVVERAIRTSGNTPQGLRVEDGLIGGEDLVVNPPAELKGGARVVTKDQGSKQ
ncbi:MAG: efflux RND transporter periplasmic adaptor subunit [Acidobacteria bacterium]|nr:efflux RND transporter periplasmic adaptor subunit [Acidobacteriota bacterium]